MVTSMLKKSLFQLFHIYVNLLKDSFVHGHSAGGEDGRSARGLVFRSAVCGQ